jgi:hypothetical protein
VQTLRLIACFISLAVLVTLGSPRAYAQADVDPDHYENRDPEPVPQSETNAPQVVQTHYEGNFVLPYTVQCNRNILPAGKYSISVDSEGRTVRVTLNRRGHTLRIEGITQKQNQKRRRNMLVVERNGATRQLSVIQVGTVGFGFISTLALERPAGGKPRNLQELPLILADSWK